MCLFQQLIITLEATQVLKNEDILYISQFIQSFNIQTVPIILLIEVLLLLE